MSKKYLLNNALIALLVLFLAPNLAFAQSADDSSVIASSALPQNPVTQNVESLTLNATIEPDIPEYSIGCNLADRIIAIKQSDYFTSTIESCSTSIVNGSTNIYLEATIIPTEAGRAKESFPIVIGSRQPNNKFNKYGAYEVTYSTGGLTIESPVLTQTSPGVYSTTLTANTSTPVSINSTVEFYYINAGQNESIESCMITTNGNTCQVSNVIIRQAAIDSGTIYAQLAKFARVSTKITDPNPPVGTKKIFVTTAAFTGNLGGFAGANTKCASDSQAAGGTYKALLNGNNATTNGTTYVRTDGTTVIAMATGGNLVEHNDLQHSISTGQDAWAWTGGGGDIAEFNCNGWTSVSTQYGGITGTINAATAAWYYTDSDSGETTVPAPRLCDTLEHLYCVQQQ